MEAASPNGAGNKFRAILLMTFVECWLIFSIYNYLDLFFEQKIIVRLFSIAILPFVVILFIKWFTFIKDNKWLTYNRKFDDWPKAKNLKGTYIVTASVIVIFGNLILSGYL
ncbi:MAG: hypothetical protein ACHQHN_05980 [Sphingobacteriales bacterium]